MSVCLGEDAFRAWGRELGRLAVRERLFVALYGPLGAGKTTLIQAACDASAVSDLVTSPTFGLVHWYRSAAGRIAHADLYRVRGLSELPALGWEDLESGEVPVFLEWAEHAEGELPPDRWEVRLGIPADREGRTVEARALGRVPPIPDPAAFTDPADARSC